MQMSVTALKKRIEKAWNETDQWRSYLDDAYKLAAPGRNRFGGTRTPGDQPGNEVFDSTLMSATNRFANRLQAELYPAFQEWVKLTPDKPVDTLEEDEQRQIAIEAEVATALVFATIGGSNFSTIINPVLIDLAFGQAAIHVDDTPIESDQLLEFVAVNPADLAFDCGPHGATWGIFRRHRLPAWLVEKTWQKADVPDTPEWRDKVEKSMTGDVEVDVDEACYYCSKDGVWHTDILLNSDPANRATPLRILGTKRKQCRWIVPRWSHITGESRGRGPVLQALPEAKSLNKAKELLLINGSFQIHPAQTYLDDGVFNPGNFSLIPGSLTPVGYNSGARGATIQKLDVGGDLHLTQFIFEDMQMSIKKIMLDDQLPPEQGAVRSATEWNARQQELANNIGAPFGRIFHELTRPLIEVVLDILRDRGILEKHISIKGKLFDLKVTSPFAQAQNVNEVGAMAHFLELAGLYLAPEEYEQYIKKPSITSYFAQRLGLPLEETVYTAAEVEQKKAEEQQQAAAMMAAEQQAEIAKEEVKRSDGEGAQQG